MQPSNALTPYPVLSSFSDCYDGVKFDAEITAELRFASLYLEIAFELTDQALLDLIHKGKAAYAVHVECPSISFRMVERTNLPRFSKILPQSKLNDCVEICTFIVATEELSSFSSPNFNSDYAGRGFDIGVGGILAIGPSVKVDIADSEKLANNGSIIKVMKAPGQTAGMRVNTDQSAYVLITLSSELYDIYFRLGNGPDQEYVFSLIMLPALQTILSRLIDGDGEDKEWAQVLIEMLEDNGLSVSALDHADGDKSILAVAQAILDEPVARAMFFLNKKAVD